MTAKVPVLSSFSERITRLWWFNLYLIVNQINLKIQAHSLAKDTSCLPLIYFIASTHWNTFI